MAEHSNGPNEDLNQSEDCLDTSQRNADSVGKTFLRNVKAKWNKVPHGWAQKRTSSKKESLDSDSLQQLPGTLRSSPSVAPPGGEDTE